MSKRQHYLSRCIMRNFISKEGEPFWEYDCATGATREKSIKTLFSNYHLWSDDFETTLANDFENLLAPLFRDLSIRVINRQHIIGPHSIEESQYNGMQIQDDKEREILSKLLFQQILLQMNNGFNTKNSERLMSVTYQEKGLNLQYPILVEINPFLTTPPILLMDAMFFMFIAPTRKIDKIGNICYMFPINERRYIIWGTAEDAEYFTRKYCDIHKLNLCRIEQQSKQCRIATQNKEYLEFVTRTYEKFRSKDEIRIVAIRSEKEI